MGPLQLGMTLSQKYRVDRLLAESSGVVLYEAMDIARAQRVWIKILQREFLMNADALERFQVEASGAGVLDVGKSSDGLPYLVATEFEAAKATQKAPLPKAPPVPASCGSSPPLPRLSPANSKSKTTLPGVAPPPAPMRRLELQDEPPPVAPVLRWGIPAAIEAATCTAHPIPSRPRTRPSSISPIIMAQPNVPAMSVTAPMVTLPFAKALAGRPNLEPQPSEPIELPARARGRRGCGWCCRLSLR